MAVAARSAWSFPASVWIFTRPRGRPMESIWSTPRRVMRPVGISGSQRRVKSPSPDRCSTLRLMRSGRRSRQTGGSSSTNQTRPPATDPDIVVRPFPEVDEGQWRVGSGRRPVWSADGREILYVTDDGISRVAVSADAESGALTLARPSPLLDMPGVSSFDLSPDGERLAIHRLPVDPAAREIRV